MVLSPVGNILDYFRRCIIKLQITLHAVLAERSGISPEMALRLGALLGNGPQLWVDMQSKYDLQQAEAKLHDVLAQIHRIDHAAA